MRSFFGLGLAIRLFDTGMEHSLAEPKTFAIVHEQLSDHSFEVLTKLELSDTLSGGLAALKLNAVDGWIDSLEKQKQWNERNFEEMRAVFRDKKKAEPILLGS